jgi:hypothetical protein
MHKERKLDNKIIFYVYKVVIQVSVGVISHSGIAAGVEPDAHHFYVMIGLYRGDRLEVNSIQYHFNSNLWTKAMCGQVRS